jgi:hypothetical protein
MQSKTQSINYEEYQEVPEFKYFGLPVKVIIVERISKQE